MKRIPDQPRNPTELVVFNDSAYDVLLAGQARRRGETLVTSDIAS